MVLLDWLPLAALRSLTFHFFVFFFSKAFGWLVFDVVFFSKNHWRQLVGCCCSFCLFSLIRLVGGVAVHFQKLLWWGWIVCVAWIIIKRCCCYFCWSGWWVAWLPLATRDMCRDAGDAGVTVSRTTPMHHINDHSNNSSSIFSEYRYTYLK